MRVRTSNSAAAQAQRGRSRPLWKPQPGLIAPGPQEIRSACRYRLVPRYGPCSVVCMRFLYADTHVSLNTTFPSIIRPLIRKQFAGFRQDHGAIGAIGIFERRAVGRGHIGRAHPHDRAIEVLERLLRDQAGDLGAHAAE
jgi:hypothetical protein